MNDKLQGIIIPAVTPFDSKGNIDFQRMQFNYNQWNKTDIRGYMCLGSNGEFRSLNDSESLDVIHAASQFKDKDKTLIAGVGRESLHQTLDFIDRVQEEEDLDIDFISVLTPCYFAKLMTDEAMVRYYKAVADFSRYPVLLYCAPGFVNSVCLSVEAVLQLADHPNIHGIKDTSSHMMEDYMEVLSGREDFEVMAGSLGNLLKCLDSGGHGGVVSAANYLPDKCAEFLRRYEEGGREKSIAYFESLQKLAKETGGRASVAGVKCSMNLMGYQGGYPRLPVLPVGKEMEEDIKKVLDSVDL